MVFGSTHLFKKTEENADFGGFPQGKRTVFAPSAFSCRRSAKKTMKRFFTTKRLCRAGIIAALYVALTYAFGAIAYTGILEIRPAEALTILPLFYAEAVPALWIGCMLANVGSQFIAYDVPVGGLATLVAALCTYGAGRLIRHHVARMVAGGLFPVLVNAFVIPVIIVFLCEDLCGYATVSAAYWVCFGSMCATEALWVYALGGMLYFAIVRLRQRGVSAFCDEVKKTGEPPAPETAEPQQENG